MEYRIHPKTELCAEFVLAIAAVVTLTRLFRRLDSKKPAPQKAV